MSEEAGKERQEGARQIQLRDSGVATHYASFFTVAGGREAVLISFGNQFTRPDQVEVEQKTVLSPANAKRLAITLGQVIRRYEEEHGEIDITVKRPVETPRPGA